MMEYLRRIYGGSRDAFNRKATSALLRGDKAFIITANPEILMAARNDADIREMLLSGADIVPDGISVVKAMRQCGLPAQERITGVDLAEHLLQAAGENGKRVFLLGAKEAVVSALAAQLQARYPQLQLRYHNGYDGDKDAIIESALAEQPDLVVVALGVPAQERLIYRHFSQAEKGVFVGVGGSFDVLSGQKRRAPAFFVKTNTEWLYRILREPSRLPRFYRSNIKFMRYIVKARKEARNEL